MKKVFTLTVATLISYGAMALSMPIQSHFDSHMQSINYNGADVTAIKAKDGYVTAISFGKDELVNDIAVGFDRGWQVVDSQNTIYLKPVAISENDVVIEPNPKDWNTNLLVTTNKNHYAFNLILVPAKAENNAYFMMFKYPEEIKKLKKDQLLLAQQESESQKINAELNQFTVPKNWDYVMKVGKDSRTIAPTFAYDDGVRTYLGFKSETSIPAVFYYQGNQEMMSNTSQKKQGQFSVVVIHKTAKRFILRSGNQVVGIINNGFGKNLATNVETSNNNILRIVK
ncbi:P-type conjugative transfer protein VirB9 [Actinobacillus delphinicola]|uniref:P-type conjugative transfer protein VirB9 n=1 Tax=Actinobacillus delphinicola TaxID=51161 RepID=UPI0024435644|nr:P-type conjugative transfer protein VirB9 [Actinobacillus delphinicola]MDG6896496.1 P-type conjugative transfer protein VirB9 [Actinobacillus delphinicola]